MQLAATLYLAIGTLIVAELYPVVDRTVVWRGRGSLAWWLGGLIAGLLVACLWLPIVTLSLVRAK